MTIKKIFKSTLPAIRYIFKDGKNAVFCDGVYMTDDEKEIKELMDEVVHEGRGKSRHPHVYVDSDEKEVDSNAMSPMDIIKAKAREEALKEIREEQARNMGNTNNASTLGGMGTTETHKQISPTGKSLEQVVNVNHDADLKPAVKFTEEGTAAPVVTPSTGMQNTATLTAAAKPAATIIPKKD